MLRTKVRVNKNHPLPRHLQVRHALMEMVTSGQWKSGDKIPAETNIAEDLGVSKMTVNKAILALTAEGLFIREVGRGTFITEQPPVAVDNQREKVDRSLIQVVLVVPPDAVSDSEYTCSLLLAMRCAVNPLETRLSLRHVRGMGYLDAWYADHSAGWVLIAPVAEDIAGLRSLAAAHVPAVVLGATWSEVDLPFVDSDNAGGVRMAVEHLVALGHRRIGMLYGGVRSSNTQQRLQGFRQTVTEQNLPLREDWIIDADDDMGIHERTQAMLRALLVTEDCPTAFVAAGPFIARSFLRLAQEMGIVVPHQLSIVGFDDPSAVSNLSPALTTVRQPLEEMGQTAIRILHGVEPLANVGCHLPCRLIVRESTAPPIEGNGRR